MLADRVLNRAAELRCPLPPTVTRARVSELLSTALLASLHHEELRPLSFRVGLLKKRLSSETEIPGAPAGPERIAVNRFSEAHPYRVEELRKLAIASSFSRSLLAVAPDADGQLVIDGILQTGPLWLRAQQGGRGGERAIFPGLCVHVLAPGSVEIFYGGTPLAALQRGLEPDRRLNIFDAAWLQQRFEHVRQELLELSRAAESAAARDDTVELDPMFFSYLSQQMFKRMLAAIRASNHGGTVIIVPREMQEQVVDPSGDLRMRAGFAPSAARSRHRDLMLRAAALLRSLGGGMSTQTAGWAEYAEMSDPALDVIDNELFEEAHFIAALTNTDGAVVLNDRFEVLGFGAEILCHELEVTHVTRALDIDGKKLTPESVEHVGTRHRSVYRFVTKYPSALALVISQDGLVSLVVNRNGQVICFEHDELSASSFVL